MSHLLSIMTILSFSFQYQGYRSGSFEWRITRQADGVLFEQIQPLHHPENAISEFQDASFMDELEKLCRKHFVRLWNGYNKADSRIKDGSAFTLRITYANGREVYAHGVNRQPFGYNAFREDLDALCKPIADRLRIVPEP